ncbi:MAG: hypothetical protein ABR578_12215 [Chromatocurvus sp.]
MQDEREYFLDKPENVKRLLRVFYAACIILALLDFVIHRHVYHSFERLWLFYPIYGFVGCVLLVLVSKWMRSFLMRDECYYEDLDQTDGKPAGDAHDA